VRLVKIQWEKWKKGKAHEGTAQQSHSQADHSIRSVVFIPSHSVLYFTLLSDTFSLYPLTLFIASSAAHHQTRLRLLLHSSLGSVLVLVLPEGGFPTHLPSVLPHLSRIVLPCAT
jgi:hypothetical protein